MKLAAISIIAMALILGAAEAERDETTNQTTSGNLLTVELPIATICTTDSGGYTGPMIVYSNDGKACDLAAFAKAANDLAEFLSGSDDPMISADIYRTPAAQLRHEADRMDRRDAAIRAFRAQLDKCGWMAEPGAFDRQRGGGTAWIPVSERLP